jgi:hypothetical protein
MSSAANSDQWTSIKSAIRQATDARVPTSTAYRWATAGLVIGGQHHRMKCRFIGGKVETTVNAVRDFLKQIEAAKIEHGNRCANRQRTAITS